MSAPHTTEAAAVAEVARESKRFGHFVQVDDQFVRLNVLRDGEKLDIRSHERFAANPMRARGASTVGDVPSFVRLLAMEQHRDSTVFADEARGQLTAVINFHGWRDHRVQLQLTKSDAFTRWHAYNNTYVSQGDFAELIEDGLAEIYAPDPATMMEIAQTFHAHKATAFESGHRLTSGAVRFQYHEQIDAKAGQKGDIEIPSTFTLRMPVWRGGAHVEMQAALRYRFTREGLRLGFKIAQLDDVLRLAFEATAADVTAQIEDAHTVVYGAAPAAIEAMP